MRTTLALVVCLLAIPLAASAPAYWSAGGSGGGDGAVATMPIGNQPAATGSGQTVSLSWSQNTFQGFPLGSLAGGGYRIKRYAQGSMIAITPNGACGAAISGNGPTLQCSESAVPYGVWEYTVTPELDSFTGTEGNRSAPVSVAPPAPSLDTATAQNPASGQTTGAIQVSWTAVTGATGYNIYRRTASGSYDFAQPLNGSTPYGTGTTYTDTGAGLTGGTTYSYVVRAVAGSPAAEGPSSNERSATAIARPAAPTAVTAAAQAGGQVGLGWAAVPGVAGYNVYRRTASGSYNYGSRLNGATPVTATSYADTTATNGSTYLYVVRAVITGAGGAQVESIDSGESNAATADATPPAAPLGVAVNNGGNVLASATCGFASGTRFINNAGKASVSVTATIPTPEAGESVVFSATTPGSTAQTATVAAPGTSVSTTMNLSALLDGTVTLTARTMDQAGNLSTTVSTTNAVVKDTVGAPLSGLAYTDNLLTFADTIAGTSQCGAAIIATETVGPNVGRTFPTAGTFTVGSSGTFSGLGVEALAGTLLTAISYRYSVVATDLAGNAGTAVSISGSDTK